MLWLVKTRARPPHRQETPEDRRAFVHRLYKPFSPSPRARGMSNPPLIVLPPKNPKPSPELGSQLVRALADGARVSGTQLKEEARSEAANLQAARDKLESIKSYTPYMAEAAAMESYTYAAMIERLESRFDQFGAELQVPLKWRDAWKPKAKFETMDLQVDRVGALFAAAAAFSYCAAQAQPRGGNGLKEAADFFQKSAHCLAVAHDLTKAAVWGLRPRWDPNALTGDMRPEMLSALRQLMLAQAQRAFHEKACSEQHAESLKAKVCMGAATLFAEVVRAFESRPELVAEVTETGGYFTKADTSWLGKLKASQLWAEALAEEHAANEEKEAFRYGHQVARLQRAVAKAKAASSAASADEVEGSEWQAIREGTSRLEHKLSHADHENKTIYTEDVPPPASLDKLEGKVLVKPVAVDVALGPDPFTVLLPQSVRDKVNGHHRQIQTLLQTLSKQTSDDTAQAAARLRELHLPHDLDVVTQADRELPPHTKSTVQQAKAVCNISALLTLRTQTEKVGDEANELRKLVETILAEEEKADREFKQELPQADLNTLPSSVELQALRSRVSELKTKLEKSADVTKELGERFDAAIDDMQALEPPIDEIESQMPHLDGTPLADEPCVVVLRSLTKELADIPTDMAATLGAAQQHADAHQQDSSVAEKIRQASAEEHAGLVDSYMEQFTTTQAALQALQARRSTLLGQVESEHVKFVQAKGDASSYPERQEFFRKLMHGAEELQYLHQGFKEGAGFYTRVRPQLEEANQRALMVCDRRKEDRLTRRRQLVEAVLDRSPAPAPVAVAVPRHQSGAAFNPNAPPPQQSARPFNQPYPPPPPQQSARVQAQPVQAQPVQAQPVQAQPVRAQPVQAQPVQAQPVRAPPLFNGGGAPQPQFNMQPVQAQPVQAQPVPYGGGAPQPQS